MSNVMPVEPPLKDKPKRSPRGKARGNLKPDTLSPEELAADYGYAASVIAADPDIKKLFDLAVKEQWLPNRFAAGLRNTNWFKNNSEYAREAFVKRNTGGADWTETQNNARMAVEAAALAAGSSIDETTKNSLITRYINEGWDRDGRQNFLVKALTASIKMTPAGVMTGQAGDVADQLRKTAVENGIRYSNDYYQSAARSINGGLSNIGDWDRDIREQAASLYPIYSEKIRAGVNVRALASPYIETMSQLFEVSSESINLDDPYIRSALGGFTDTGDPAPTNLWDFEKKLRKDPRWMGTLNANNQIANVGERVMQMFGIRG